MEWFNIVVYCILGFFAVKTIFYDFPIFSDAKNWFGYLKSVGLIASIFFAWFVFGRISENYPWSTFVLVVFIMIILCGIMYFSSNAKHEDEES